MAERFFKRYTLPPKQYLENCPIIIEAGSLLQDTKTGAVLAQIKFRNIGEDTVTACRVCIHAFGPDGKEIEGLEEYWYMDLNVACDQDFGSKVPVILPKASTSRFSVAITEVVLSSGKVWEHASAQWQQIPKQETVNQVLPSAELCAQYYLEMGVNHSEYYPVCHDRFFLCTCGAANDASTDTCHTCNRKRIAVLQMADQQYLVRRVAERLAKEEQERLAREQDEAERKEQERIDAEKRAEQRKKTLKKVRKVAGITAAAIFVVGIGIAGYWYAVNRYIPTKRHEQAVALYNAGEYEQARDFFVSLNGFGSSNEWLPICEEAILQQKYLEAVKLLEVENFTDAKNLFVQLGSYGESAEKLTECEIGITYQNAQNFLATGKFEEAIEVFIELGTYQDSVNQKLAAYYGLGEQKVAEREWDEAITAFTNAGLYKDAALQINEVKYNQALELKENHKYLHAAKLLQTIRGYKDVDMLLKNDEQLKYMPGNYVVLGTYPQTTQGNDQTPIEWLILEKAGNKVLLISRYALDVKPYNNKWTAVSWDKCTLRSWLNKDFMNNAFTTTETKAILTTHVIDRKNPMYYNAQTGKNTDDKVFLLNIQEAEKYFADNVDRNCAPTNYVVGKNPFLSADSSIDEGRSICWWLRSSGASRFEEKYGARTAGSVNNRGSIDYFGVDVDESFCIRPAMWVDIESGIF